MVDRNPNGKIYILGIGDEVVIIDGTCKGRTGTITRIAASKITVALHRTPVEKKAVKNFAPDWVYPMKKYHFVSGNLTL